MEKIYFEMNLNEDFTEDGKIGFTTLGTKDDNIQRNLQEALEAAAAGVIKAIPEGTKNADLESGEVEYTTLNCYVRVRFAGEKREASGPRRGFGAAVGTEGIPS